MTDAEEDDYARLTDALDDMTKERDGLRQELDEAQRENQALRDVLDSIADDARRALR